jgi:hypothetical protein
MRVWDGHAVLNLLRAGEDRRMSSRQDCDRLYNLRRFINSRQRELVCKVLAFVQHSWSGT